MNRVELRRRLDTLANVINPMRARMQRLTDEQRCAFDRWRTQCDVWLSERPGDAAYLAISNGERAPTLRPDIADILFVRPAPITRNMTETQAAEAYRRFANGE